MSCRGRVAPKAVAGEPDPVPHSFVRSADALQVFLCVLYSVDRQRLGYQLADVEIVEIVIEAKLVTPFDRLDGFFPGSNKPFQS